MSRVAIEQLLHLLADGFEGVGEAETDGYHSLLRNLSQVSDDQWRWTPPGGRRSIAAIVGHVGWAKYMYDDHAFGDASMDWRGVPRPGTGDRNPTPDELIHWLKAAHESFVDHVAALSDEDLSNPSRANWGEMKDMRWIITTIIEHDLYHAGEINHIRALCQGNDDWPYGSA